MDRAAELAWLSKEIDRLDDMGGHDHRVRELRARYQELTKGERDRAAEHARVAAKLKALRMSLEARELAEAALQGGSAKQFIKKARGPISDEDYISVDVYPEMERWPSDDWNPPMEATRGVRRSFRIPFAQWRPGDRRAGRLVGPFADFGPVAVVPGLDQEVGVCIVGTIRYILNIEGYGRERHDPTRMATAQGLFSLPAYRWTYSTGAKAFQERREEVQEWFERWSAKQPG